MVKKSACQAGNLGSVSGSGRSPGEGNGNPLQYSCLGNPVDRGVWRAAVHGVAEELDMTEQLSTLEHALWSRLISPIFSLGFPFEQYTYPISLPSSCTLLLLLLLSRFSRVRLCDPIDGSPPGSPVPGILQARTLEWVAISFSNAWKWKVKGKLLSRVRLLATPWTAAHQAPPSMGFARQGDWSGCHCLLLMYSSSCQTSISRGKKTKNPDRQKSFLVFLCALRHVRFFGYLTKYKERRKQN